MGKIHLFLVSLIYSLMAIVLNQKGRSRENNSGDYSNVNINRTIDLQGNIIKIETRILIKSLRIDPIYTYKFPLLKNNTKNLVNLKASIISTGDNEQIGLKISPLREKNNEYEFYEFNFKTEPMNLEEERILVINEDYFEKLEMLPKKISLKEDQLVVFSDIINHVSFYPTETQQTIVKLPSTKTDVIDYTLMNASKEKGQIVYNFDKPIAPLTHHKLRVHYEDNKPLSCFNYAVKIVEVSHWGNVAIEERYSVENIGAKLEGEFGRVDYDESGRSGGKNAIRELKARLPLKSNGLWYRDEIGNVSTSRAAREWDDVRLDLYPRFPILGGWKSNFNIGYNLPSKFLVSEQKELYSLNVTYGTPFDDILVRNYTMKIVLPEGASDIKIHLPKDFKYRRSDEKYYSFIDLFGRPMINIQMNNQYNIHNIPLEITYKLNSYWLFVKPIVLISFFFALFAFLIVYFRTEFSLDRHAETPKQKTD